jgi:transcriptional pleiotropic regulator of transition state genes
MHTTGIVRRIDDLGRIVIPKDIRRALNIYDGAPLELYLDGDVICFKRYLSYNETDWQKASKLVSQFLSDFVICNAFGDKVAASRGSTASIIKTLRDIEVCDGLCASKITNCGEPAAYLITSKDADKAAVKTAQMVLQIFLEKEL